MILDYIPGTQMYAARIPAADRAAVHKAVNEYGFDVSLSASTDLEAVVLTADPYAAVALYESATDRAREQLGPIAERIAQSWARESNARIACPADKELWPYQRAGVRYALDVGNVLIADQPGLGKTCQAICYANELQAHRVLVLCPAAVRLQWAKEIRAWTTMRWPYNIHTILHGKHGVHPKANWTICSYDLASTAAIGSGLAALDYDLLILDEAHMLKTVSTNRTRAVFGGGVDRPFPAISARSKRICALTGTPTPNRPREAYTLARGLCYDSIDWQSEDSFNLRYNPSMRREGKREDGSTYYYTDERSGREHELNARLRSHFMVRREKRGPNGVLNQLEYPIYDIIQLEETGPVKQALKAESMLQLDPDTLQGASIAIDGAISTVRKQMGLALAPQIVAYARNLLDSGEEKIVLFGWHKEVLQIFQQGLSDYGVARTLGPGDKAACVDRFMADPKCRVFMGNTLASGVGVDGLQKVCNRIIVGEPSWTPGDNQQVVDRVDRIGQKNTVLADFMVAPKSFSERVLATSLKKLQVIHKTLDVRHA